MSEGLFDLLYVIENLSNVIFRVVLIILIARFINMWRTK